MYCHTYLFFGVDPISKHVVSNVSFGSEFRLLYNAGHVATTVNKASFIIMNLFVSQIQITVSANFLL